MLKRNLLVLAAMLFAGMGFAGFERAEVKWQFPRPNCHEGIPFGNAQSGYLVFGGDNVLKVTVGRDDTWDHRGGYAWYEDQNYTNIAAVLRTKDEKQLKALFRPPEYKYGDPKNPTIIPIGRYEFTLPPEMHLLKGELDTATGIAEITLAKGEDDEKVGTVKLAMDRQSGVLAIEWPDDVTVTGKAIPAWKQKWYSTDGETPLCLPAPVPVAIDGGEGFVQPIPADPDTGSGFVTRNGESFMVAVRGETVESAADATRTALEQAAKLGAKGIRKNSKDYWRQWWNETPEIEVPDPLIREIHDLGMYKFGSMAGSDGVPATLQGPWIEDYRLPPWHGDYHFNINVQLCYWPAFRGNHLETLKPLFRMVLGWRPLMRENARKFAGIPDGYMLAHSVDDRGTTIGGYWSGTMDFAVSPWICQMMMRYVRMSGDRKFLKDEGAYDFMKGVMRMLRAIMHEDAKGFSYPVSTSPEYDKLGGWGKNSSFQLAATHRLVKDLIEAAQMLGEPIDPMWREVQGKLPLASFKNGWGGEIELWQGLTLPETHRHHSHLAGFVPFDILDMDQWYIKDSLKKTLFSEEWFGQGWWSGWSFGWYSMLQTRWGNADAAEWLLKTWERMYTNPGHGSRHDVYFPGLCVMRRGTNARAYGVVGDAKDEEIMQIDGAMACTAAIHAMMVDESFGKLYVFRGAPERWRDCSFRNVLTDYGVLVSGERRKGKVTYVEFKAKRGGHIRLVSPWHPGALIEFGLKAGETRRITAADPWKWTDQMQSDWDKLKIEVKSTKDGTMQPAYFHMPETMKPGAKVPLLVVLHSWSFGYTKLDPATWGINECNRRGWAFLYPHFRGPNKTPEGLGSDLAVQDIADQVEWAKANHPIDPDRVYILGGSGGGHMALLMAGRHPEIWAGVYAACPPADIKLWYELCQQMEPGNGNRAYANDIKTACGGTPAEKPEEYRNRSATTWLHQAKNVPIQICTGLHDGHRFRGVWQSVNPIQSVNAFNCVAEEKDRISVADGELIAKEQIPEALKFTGKNPFYSDLDPILLRRYSGNACLTLFEAGHGGNYREGCYWLNRQRRGQPVDWFVPERASADDQEIIAITR